MTMGFYLQGTIIWMIFYSSYFPNNILNSKNNFVRHDKFDESIPPCAENNRDQYNKFSLIYSMIPC